MSIQQLAPAELEQFRSFSTCVVASAIETFRVRLPNTGFANSSLRCIFPSRPSVIGYAVTARIRSSDPPMEPGHGHYYERADWWNRIVTIPQPRIVVIEDVDRPAGRGAFVGEVHANILLALGCVALITNGAVRDLGTIEPLGFPLFAGNVSVSHAYAHVFDFGGAVEVGGLGIGPGDLVHCDRHGVQTIPAEIAARVPAAAVEIQRRRRELTALCHTPDFSLAKLHAAFEESESKI